jgi:hypothetical protein
MIELVGVGSMINVPSRIADWTLRRAIHDSPGAISRRKVGSISSVNARLTKRHSLRGRRSYEAGLDMFPGLGLRFGGGGESLEGYDPAIWGPMGIKKAELGMTVVEGKDPEY